MDPSMTKRDRDGALKTLSGLLKILYPGGDCPKTEMRDLLEFAMEGRARVKKHLLRIDETFEPVDFRFTDIETGEEVEVETLEHRQYRHLVRAYRQDTEEGKEPEPDLSAATTDGAADEAEGGSDLETGQLVIQENQTGISYERLFGDYLKGASRIEVVDPYIRRFHQVRNVMELCEMLLRIKPDGEEVHVSLLTGAETDRMEEQKEHLENLKDSLRGTGIHFEYEITWDAIHARSIKTDTGWKISLDRGLDIFQAHGENPFDLARISQEQRRCKPFEVTYLREEDLTFELEP